MAYLQGFDAAGQATDALEVTADEIVDVSNAQPNIVPDEIVNYDQPTPPIVPTEIVDFGAAAPMRRKQVVRPALRAPAAMHGFGAGASVPAVPTKRIRAGTVINVHGLGGGQLLDDLLVTVLSSGGWSAQNRARIQLVGHVQPGMIVWSTPTATR